MNIITAAFTLINTKVTLVTEIFKASHFSDRLKRRGTHTPQLLQH